MSEKPNRQARTIATQSKLMYAMEKLSARDGVENVTVRAVVEEAGQKNESVLQYHFKNREGLIDACHKARFAQIQKKRRQMLSQCLANTATPSMRDLCYLIVGPTFLMCKSDPGIRFWVRAFGMRNAEAQDPIIEENVVEENNSIRVITELLKDRLPHLDEQMFTNRYITVVRFLGLSLANHSKEKNAFRGPNADFFISNVIDLLVGLFTAEVSDATRRKFDRSN